MMLFQFEVQEIEAVMLFTKLDIVSLQENSVQIEFITQ